MKIRTILLALIGVVALFTGLSAFLQDRLSEGLIDEAAATQAAFVKTSALQDEVRTVQIDFKWQVQSFKDVLLRGKDLSLWERYKSEYGANLSRVAGGIASISGELQAAEYAPIAETVKRLSEQHKVVSAKYNEALDLYTKLINEKPGNALAADEAVRGIDRPLTTDLDTIAAFVRARNEANAAAAAKAASSMRGEVSLKIYGVAALLAVLVVIAGMYATHLVMSELGAEPLVLRDVAERISGGDLTTTIPSHDLDNESSLASHLLLMQMKMRSLVVGIRDETKGALDRARRGASLEEVVEDMRALSKSMRKFKTGAGEEAP